MSYFELFGLRPGFHIDKSALSASYMKAIWESHPDRNSGIDAIERTSSLNTAYKVLGDDDKRLNYLLSLHGIQTEGSGNTLPPAFLMQMMELNEQLDEAEQQKDAFMLENISHDADMEEQQLRTDLNRIGTEYDNGDQEAAIKKLAELHFKLKYLLRLKERIATFAAL